MPPKPLTRKPTVLLVDDDAAARSSLARRLKKKGYRVTACSGYDQAIARFQAGFIDAVIADWDLAPNARKKGDALFTAIRDRDWEVPLVLLSGKLLEDHQRAETFRILLNQGAVRFVERASGLGYGPVLDALQDLLVRRDLVLVRVIETLRSTRGSIPTTTGRKDAKALLADLLTDQEHAKEGVVSAIAKDFAQWEADQRGKPPPRS